MLKSTGCPAPTIKNIGPAAARSAGPAPPPLSMESSVLQTVLEVGLGEKDIKDFSSLFTLR